MLATMLKVVTRQSVLSVPVHSGNRFAVLAPASNTNVHKASHGRFNENLLQDVLHSKRLEVAKVLWQCSTGASLLEARCT